MLVQSVNSLQERKKNNSVHSAKQNPVAFRGAGTGVNPVVGLMDFIDKGGYPAKFIIQDGLGFIFPRVGKGILRGSKKVDENGNPVLDENGKQVREYNWAYAKKEGLREVITGPSAFLIPLGMLAVINKYFGRSNNVKLNYINSFEKPFTNFVKANAETIKTGEVDKTTFYKNVFKDVIGSSINTKTGVTNITAEEIEQYADEFAKRQVQIEEIKADKNLDKKARKAKLKELTSVEDSYMKLMKNKVGGTVNELGVRMTAANGDIKGGSIGELLTAMDDYYDDALKNVKKSLKDNASPDDIVAFVKKFTNNRMGSRIFTNMSIFAAVAAFFTQIPKLYNLGLKGNPALKGTAADTSAAHEKMDAAKKDALAETKSDEKAKDVAFTGMASVLEKTGDKVFNSKGAKSISDIFEFNGPSISGKAMASLLYAFCIPSRLLNAQDKYEFGEIVVRDFTAFTTLLFGSEALSRLFSDGFTKLTGLALNKKDLEDKNLFQKIGAYLSPSSSAHSVLTSKQIDSKYTDIKEYKDGINGFVEFIEKSGGDIKKALKHDKNIVGVTDEIVKKFNNGKSFADSTSVEIKAALNKAHLEKGELIEKLYKLFDANNGLLKHAKTYNSTFGFLSTLLLVPGMIIWLTDVCEKMTKRRTEKDFGKTAQTPAQGVQPKAAADKTVVQVSKAQPAEINRLRTDKLSMSGFMNK